LSNLEFYGITSKANALIKSYFTVRYQRVVIDIQDKLYSIPPQVGEILNMPCHRD
jgi:hypothetical protein